MYSGQKNSGNNPHYARRRAAGTCSRCDEKPTVHSLCLLHWFKNVASTHIGSSACWRGLKDLFDLQEGRCAYTGELLIPGVNASLDHIVPSTRGGTSDPDNIQWVAYRINRMKTDMTEEEFLSACRSILSFRLTC